MARNCKNTRQVWIDIKYFFTWLTGMKKLIFYVNNFFGSGYFFDPWYLKNDQKIAGTKNFFVSKNQFCHARQPCKGFFEICIVFSHFSARASNGPQYSNFGNKCPKLGPGTLEDMLFTNLGETLDSVPSGIVLICMKELDDWVMKTGNPTLKITIYVGIEPILKIDILKRQFK